MTTPTNVTFVASTTPAITSAWLNGVNDWVFGWFGVLGETFTALAARTALGLVTGSVTTASISIAGAVVDGTIAHGLGTDDIDFGFAVKGNNASYASFIACLLIDANGKYVMQASPSNDGSASIGSPTAPSAGNIAYRVQNNTISSAQTATIYWWARKRA